MIRSGPSDDPREAALQEIFRRGFFNNGRGFRVRHRELIERYPDDPEIAAVLPFVEATRRNMFKSKPWARLLETAHQHPESAFIHYLLAAGRGQRKELEPASDDLRWILDRNPTCLSARLLYASCVAAQGDLATAREQIESLADTPAKAEPNYFWVRMQIETASGQAGAARAWYVKRNHALGLRTVPHWLMVLTGHRGPAMWWAGCWAGMMTFGAMAGILPMVVLGTAGLALFIPFALSINRSLRKLRPVFGIAAGAWAYVLWFLPP